MSTYKKQRGYENLQKAFYGGIGQYDIPEIKPVDIVCNDWIGFNCVKTCKNFEENGVHFFLDDYQFNRVWTHPDSYINLLGKYKVVCTPDFSTYTDFPLALQIYNHYRKHWLGAYWQNLGLTVVPTVSWSDYDSFNFCFDGEPRGGCVAVSSVGTQISVKSRILFAEGYKEMLCRLRPIRIFFYGGIPCDCLELSSGIDILNIVPFYGKWRAQGGRGSYSDFLFSDDISPFLQLFPRQSATEFASNLKDAIGLQSKPYSVKDSISLSNYDRGENIGFSSNCTRVVVAYELRRRGFCVTALPSYSGDKWQEVGIGGIDHADRWRGAFRHAKTINVASGSASGTVDNIKRIMREYGHGSRAVVNVHFADKKINHVFNVENVGGRVYFLEAQHGFKYSKDSLKNIFDGVSLKDTSLTRTDHLRISSRVREFVRQGKR